MMPTLKKAGLFFKLDSDLTKACKNNRTHILLLVECKLHSTDAYVNFPIKLLL